MERLGPIVGSFCLLGLCALDCYLIAEKGTLLRADIATPAHNGVFHDLSCAPAWRFRSADDRASEDSRALANFALTCYALELANFGKARKHRRRQQKDDRC